MHGGKGSGRPATSGKFTAARAKTMRDLRCLLAVLEAVEEKRKPVYEADSAQDARDLCAVDAGYRSEAEMEARLDQPSDLEAEIVE